MAVPLELLACPQCQGPLVDDAAALRCASCDRTYAVRDDVPELVLSRPSWTEPPGLLGALAANPTIYDLVQRLAGARVIARRLGQAIAGADGLLLDAGAGTGNLEPLLPAAARYLWLDPDPHKLEGFRSKSSSFAVLGDATRLPFRNRAVAWSVSVAVSHHLDDEQLNRMLDELLRVTRDRLVFLDAVASRSPLWWIDRGHEPRSAATLQRALRERFELETVDEFTVLHRYLLVVAKPRTTG